MMTLWKIVVVASAGWVLGTNGAAATTTTPSQSGGVADSAGVAVPSAPSASTPARLAAPSLTPSFFGTTAKAEFLRRHAYSFDHYLQSEPGFVLVRRGPIGADVAFSRYGVGRGRALVLLDGVPINDPQDDVAPIVHFPVSGVGSIATGDAAGAGLARSAGIEGVVRVDELGAPLKRPSTFIELSKGNNNLRQRRVRFASAASKVGIDLGYDELLNDGYSFDAEQLVGIGVPGFGASTSRYYTMRLRGEHGLGESYAVGFRKFTSSSSGDLVSEANERRRSGHLASATTSIGRMRVALFERGYRATYPDSVTTNQTTAAYASFSLLSGPRRSLVVEAGYEDVRAEMRVAGASSAPSVAKTAASVEGVVLAPLGIEARAVASGADYHDVVTQWGAGVEAARPWSHLRIGARFVRSFRMPNLGELYLPASARGSVTVSGNKYLDAEYALETGAGAAVSFGPFTNEVRWASIEVDDAVAARERSMGGGTWVTPANGEAATMRFVEERLRIDASVRGVVLVCEGAAVLSEGDREGFFSSVPKSSYRAAARIGGELFAGTSALYAGAEYVFGDERVDYEGAALPSYEVLNLTLDARLVDAVMYLALFNVLDERYRTDGNYLMTPRTFVYGIAWTLWE